MTLFYFDVFDGLETEDCEGIECADSTAAHSRAVDEARAIAADDVLHGQLNLQDRIVVKDCDGNLLFSVYFRDVVAITF